MKIVSIIQKKLPLISICLILSFNPTLAKTQTELTLDQVRRSDNPQVIQHNQSLLSASGLISLILLITSPVIIAIIVACGNDESIDK